MKIVILSMTAIVILFLSSCTSNNNEESKTQNNEISKSTENFDWLLGNWKRNNEKENRETFEIWKKKNNSEYYGIGFTLQNNDTIKQEKIKLTKLNNNWILEVKVPEETESITFNLTSIGNKEFICENKEIDFPKKIKYWKNGTKINALVSGDEMEIPFEFERIIEK